MADPVLPWGGSSGASPLSLEPFSPYFSTQSLLLVLISKIRGRLPTLPILGRLLRSRSDDKAQNALSALTESWIYMTVLSFITQKFREIFVYMGPLNRLLNYAYIDSMHDSCDDSYRWLSVFWSQHPSFQNSRDFITTVTMEGDGSKRDSWSSNYNNSPWGDSGMPRNRGSEPEPQPKFWPRFAKNNFFFVNRKTLFRFSKKTENTYGGTWNGQSILVRCYSKSRTPLLQLLKDARKLYLKSQRVESNVQIMVYDESQHRWQEGKNRRGRSMDSLILDDHIKAKMLTDIKEFLASEAWYHSRGIGFRRGWLFEGPPGSGKTSSIQALATELDLPCYIINVAQTTMDDYGLNSALRQVPQRAIVCLEDLDIWASRVKSRKLKDDGISKKEDLKRKEDKDELTLPDQGTSLRRRGSSSSQWGAPAPGWGEEPRRRRSSSFAGSGVSLSALLNAIDGLEASDGRLTIITTNDTSQLDPALLRPGRVGVRFKYARATREHARKLFIEFYKGWKARDALDPQPLPLDSEARDVVAEEEKNAIAVAEGTAEVRRLAEIWKGFVEDGEFSLASLQGALLDNKRNPKAAIADMPNWLRESRKSAGLKRFEKAAQEYEHHRTQDVKPTLKRSPSF